MGAVTHIVSIVLVGSTLAFFFNIARFWIQRQSGYLLFFAVLLAGWPLLQLSTELLVFLSSQWRGSDEFHRQIGNELVSGPWWVTAWGMLVALFVSVSLNLIWSSEKAALLIARDSGDLIESLLHSSIGKHAVEITLETNKSYVGLVTKSGVATSAQADIEIVPLFSGYRTETGRLQLTTSYASLVPTPQNEADQKQMLTSRPFTHFRVCIAKSRIVSARLFFPDVYFEMFVGSARATQRS